MSRLNDLIDSYIRRNRAQEITGEVLNGVLNAIANTLAGGSLLRPGAGEGSIESAQGEASPVTLAYTNGTGGNDYEIDITCDNPNAYQILAGAKEVTIGENTYRVTHVERDSSVDFIIVTQEETTVVPAQGFIEVRSGATGTGSVFLPSAGSPGAASGDGAIAAGDMAYAAGEKSVAVGRASARGAGAIAAGHNVIAQNDGEVATGQYNNTSLGDGSIFSVGCGTGEGARKNAILVRRVSGQVKVYVLGVGGYTGDNPGVAQDLATVINSLQ